MPVLAEISKKLIPNSFANYFPSSSVTCLLSSKSHLVPTNTFFTSGWTFSFNSLMNGFTISKVSGYAISYKIIKPFDPLKYSLDVGHLFEKGSESEFIINFHYFILKSIPIRRPSFTLK